MLRKEIEDKLADIFVSRIENVNEKVLADIGKVIKEISTLRPTEAYKLGQILKYGGSYEKIVEELSKITKKSRDDIYKIFDEVAENNKQFAKDFYKYRGMDYIPYKKDTALKQQVEALAKITENSFMNIANTKGLGMLVEGLDGQVRFGNLQQAYSEIIDNAIISIAQGKSTFYEQMRGMLNTLGHNGLVRYESGRVRRFDSAARMNILDGIRQLNIETTKKLGEEYGADGVEVSVHENPAPDHEEIQGRQFRNEQYENIEDGGVGYDVKGRRFDGDTMRRIGEYNCYHKVFSIIVGVNEPEYSDKELEEIKERNEKGFEYEGKHYTLYEGTQLQRQLELKIRKEKDTQILARESGFKDLAEESQAKINYYTKKYNKLCNISGLQPKKYRMSVSGYRRIEV